MRKRRVIVTLSQKSDLPGDIITMLNIMQYFADAFGRKNVDNRKRSCQADAA